MSDVRQSIKALAEAHERADDLEQAIKAWQVLAGAADGNGLGMVAKSRVHKLTRRLEDRHRAQAVLDRGEDAVRAAVVDAERAGRMGLIVEIRRLQVATERTRATLTALAAALRRAGEAHEAQQLVEEAIASDPSKRSNSAAYVVLAALYRDRGQLVEARKLLEELGHISSGDAYVASGLAAVYLDYAENYGQTSLLDHARKLIGLAYAQRGADVGALYGRLAAIERRAGVA